MDVIISPKLTTERIERIILTKDICDSLRLYSVNWVLRINAGDLERLKVLRRLTNYAATVAAGRDRSAPRQMKRSRQTLAFASARSARRGDQTELRNVGRRLSAAKW